LPEGDYREMEPRPEGPQRAASANPRVFACRGFQRAEDTEEAGRPCYDLDSTHTHTLTHTHKGNQTIQAELCTVPLKTEKYALRRR